MRCRAFAERVFRGRNFGVISVPNSHEPDWRLLSIEEGEKLRNLAAQQLNCAPDVPVKCTAPMPPVLAIKLCKLGKIPQETIEAAHQAVPPSVTGPAREGSGFLLLTKIFDDPTLFQVPFYQNLSYFSTSSLKMLFFIPFRSNRFSLHSFLTLILSYYLNSWARMPFYRWFRSGHFHLFASFYQHFILFLKFITLKAHFFSLD